MERMNKKGMIRIIEAVIAIMIIAGAILVSYNEKKTYEKPDLSKTARDILAEVADNPGLRNSILTSPVPLSSAPAPGNVDSFITSRLPSYLRHETILCNVDSVCGQPSYVGEVYSGERIISADTTKYNPLKIRLFIWEA